MLYLLMADQSLSVKVKQIGLSHHWMRHSHHWAREGASLQLVAPCTKDTSTSGWRTEVTCAQSPTK